MKVGPSSVSVRRMRASRVSRAIDSPARELRRSLMKSMLVEASQSARPYLLSTARISVQRLTLRYRCGIERTLITGQSQKAEAQNAKTEEQAQDQDYQQEREQD